MSKVLKTFPIEIIEKRKDGGRITISTGALDRIDDRVLPMGAQIDNYQANPVVQYGHNYREPWATVGRTTSLEITEDGVVADFELRPAANEHDPQNIVRLLWNGDWIRTASIGFNPIQTSENDDGGLDYTEWELLEWSLVPVPMNQEALRLAMKAAEVPPDDGPTASERMQEGLSALVAATMVTSTDEVIRAMTEQRQTAPTDNTEPNNDADDEPDTDDDELSDEALAQIEDVVDNLTEVLT